MSALVRAARMLALVRAATVAGLVRMRAFVRAAGVRALVRAAAMAGLIRAATTAVLGAALRAAFVRAAADELARVPDAGGRRGEQDVLERDLVRVVDDELRGGVGHHADAEVGRGLDREVAQAARTLGERAEEA